MSQNNATTIGTRTKLAAGMAVFGSATPVSKIVTQAMPVFIGSGIRVALGALVLAPAAYSRLGETRQFTRRNWMTVFLIALFGMFGFSVLMLYGMQRVSGVTGAVVMSTTPAVTAAGSVLFLKEKLTWRKGLAILLAVSGVLVLQLSSAGSGNGGNDWLGALLVFGAVCCEATYTILGKSAAEKMDPILVTFLSAAISVPMFVPFAIWQWADFQPADVGLQAWSAVIWYGAGTLALGSWLWYAGLAKAQGSIAAGFMGIMPASALILSYLLLREEFQLAHLAGFAIVFAGVLLVAWEHARMDHSH